MSLEEQELLTSLLENKDELKALYAVIEDVVVGYELAVNKVMVVDKLSENDLLYKRLKADGARKLLLDIARLLKLK